MRPPSVPASGSPPADTRAAILEAARRLFAQSGFDGVSMREIGQRCGVTMPTLYHHFRHKPGLYAACRDEAIAQAGRALSSALDEVAAPPAALEAFATALCEQLAGDGDLLAFLQHDTAGGGQALGLIFTPALLARVDACFAMRSGSVSPPPGSAWRLCAFAYGHAVLSTREAGRPRSAPPRLALQARTLIAAAAAGEAGQDLAKCACRGSENYLSLAHK